MHRLKNVYNDIVRKYGNITVQDFRKYEKLQYKKNKLKLDIDFLNNCKQLAGNLKFLIFKLVSVSYKNTVSIFFLKKKKKIGIHSMQG